MKKPVIIAAIAIVGGVSGAMLATSLMKKVDQDVAADTELPASNIVYEQPASEPDLLPAGTAAEPESETIAIVEPVAVEQEDTPETLDETAAGAESMGTPGSTHATMEEIPFAVPEEPVSVRARNAVNSSGVPVPSLDRNYGDGRPVRPYAMQEYYGVENPQPMQPIDEDRAYEANRNRLKDSIQKLR